MNKIFENSQNNKFNEYDKIKENEAKESLKKENEEPTDILKYPLLSLKNDDIKKRSLIRLKKRGNNIDSFN